MEKEVFEIINERGPLTGSELIKETGRDGMSLWRTCRLSSRLLIKTVGCDYLRLDRRVEGFARLSPSILRGFLTYSVVGTKQDPLLLEQRAGELNDQIETISRTKMDICYRLISAISGQIGVGSYPDLRACFFLGGDIVYNMAHDVQRPERSTGKMVRGSDMDLVVVADDLFPEDLLKRLDDALYREKYRILISPYMREELDYVVKRFEKVRRQVLFDSFRDMVACKILQESRLLKGDERLFRDIRELLKKNGVSDRLKELEKRARSFRSRAEEYLLKEGPECVKEDCLNLFYPSEESEEFE